MKKIMMLLMVSVFFFVGDVCDGVAQSNKNGIPQILSSASGEINARLGSTAQWSYFLFNLENWDTATLFFQRTGQAPKFIIALGHNGFIYRPTPSDNRFNIFFNSYRSQICVTLSGVQLSDEGIFYLMVRKGTTEYFSYGDRLIVKYD